MRIGIIAVRVNVDARSVTLGLVPQGSGVPYRLITRALFIVTMAGSLAAAPATRPASTSSAATQPADPAEVLLWMGAELDGLRPGTGSDRLQNAATLAIKWRMTSAIPYFIAMYDGATSPMELKNRAALAVIQIDPDYSLGFARELMRNEYLAMNGYTRTVHALAACVLAEHGDVEGRQFLLEGYRGFLDGLNQRRGTNAGFASQIETLRDPSMAAEIAQLRDSYANNELATAAIDGMVEQIKLNAKDLDELLSIAEDAKAADETRRKAVAAVHAHFDAKSLPRLDALAKALAESTTKPTTQEILNFRQGHPTGLRADAFDLATLARSAAASIRSRLRSATQPTSQPSIAINAVREPDDLPANTVACAIQRVEPPKGDRVTDAKLTVRTLDGYMHYDVRVRERSVLERAMLVRPEAVVLLQPADDWSEVRSIREYDLQPGEAAPNCWMFVREMELPNDPWKHHAVVLRKLGREVTAAIPIRSRAGKNVADTKLSAAVAPLRPGTMVEVRLEQVESMTALSFIAAYRPSIPAKFIAWRAETNQVDLEIGRQRKTFHLPDESESPDPKIAALQRASFQPGYKLRVVIEDANDPHPQLREMRVDGYIVDRPPENWVMVHAGRTSLQCNKRGDAYDGFLSVGGFDDEASHVQLGLAKMLDDEKLRRKWIKPEQLEPLRAVRNVPSSHSQDDARTMLALLETSRNPDTALNEQRLAVEKMYLMLQDISRRQDAIQADQIQRVREILNDDQYAALTDAGRINPKPRLRP
jgi:hypothetical protein